MADTGLEQLIAESLQRVAAMTPEEREAMYAKQREGYVRAEMSWPKPKVTWVNGVKVYDSYD